MKLIKVNQFNAKIATLLAQNVAIRTERIKSSN